MSYPSLNNPEGAAELNHRGIMAFQAGDFATATQLFSTVANTLQDGIGEPSVCAMAETVNRNLLMAAQNSGQWAVATKALRRIVKLSPNDLGAWAELDRIARLGVAATLRTSEEVHNVFITSHIRPKETAALGLCRAADPEVKIAVVIQGPLLLEHEFTLETVKLYRKIFPTVELIVSTWYGENESVLQAMRNAGAEVILSKLPQIAGLGNVNMQLVSAYAGIAHAKDKGCKYILKSRTDYRIYNPQFFLNALGLLDAFPLIECSGGRQLGRIMVFDDINLYRLYTVHDRNMFGHASDIHNYWSAPQDLRRHFGSDASPMDSAKRGVCESYYLLQYMEFLGKSLCWTLEDYWAILKDHFVVMDHGAADMYWCKHDRYNEYRMRQYFFDSNFAILGFHEWLRIMQGQWPFVSDARISERNHGSSISDILAENYKSKHSDHPPLSTPEGPNEC